VRAAVRDIDPSSDWREVSGEGVRYCVPATWAISVEQLRRNAQRPNVWRGDRGGVGASRSSTIEMDFPRAQIGPGKVDGFFEGTIGGSVAEFFHRPVRRPQDPRATRTETLRSGYETYALWREQGVYFHGYAETMNAVARIRLVFQTARFDNGSH
jgi:hypothetical protein